MDFAAQAASLGLSVTHHGGKTRRKKAKRRRKAHATRHAAPRKRAAKRTHARKRPAKRKTHKHRAKPRALYGKNGKKLHGAALKMARKARRRKGGRKGKRK